MSYKEEVVKHLHTQLNGPDGAANLMAGYLNDYAAHAKKVKTKLTFFTGRGWHGKNGLKRSMEFLNDWMQIQNPILMQVNSAERLHASYDTVVRSIFEQLHTAALTALKNLNDGGWHSHSLRRYILACANHYQAIQKSIGFEMDMREFKIDARSTDFASKNNLLAMRRQQQKM